MNKRVPFFTDEHYLFQESVRAFVAREASRERVRQWDMNKEYPYELYRKMADLGWLGIGVPEAYGGCGLDAMYLAILCEEVSRYSSDLGSGYALMMWGALNIVKWGTEEQKAYYLPKFVKGDIRFSFSMTEPNSGSDAASLTTSAVPDGDHFVINGQKVFSTAADKDDNVIMLVARTDNRGRKQEGLSLFLVPNTTPGIEIRRLNTLARRILGTTEVFLTDVRVPGTALLGPIHQAWRCLQWHLDIERVTGAASYMGNAQGTLDVACEYAKQRVQFGKPIGQFQVIAHMLADMKTEVDAARLLVYRAAWLAAQGIECHEEASIAKLFASESSFRIAAQGMQILGGYAQMPEYDMERFYRDSKQSMVGGGTSQIQRTIIARSLGL